MVSFNDPGTEAEALLDQDSGGWGRRGRTRYTDCRYCGKRFPLRDIAAHVKSAHFEESTRYTNCWRCGGKFPLREIRAHFRGCDGTAPAEEAPAFEKIPHPSARPMPGDMSEYRLELGFSIEDRVREIREGLDRVDEKIIVAELRRRGWIVLRPESAPDDPKEGFERCRYCNERIERINFALGPEWRHWPSEYGNYTASEMYGPCRVGFYAKPKGETE